MRSFSRRLSLAITALVAGACLTATGDAKASGYLTARFGSDHGTPAHAEHVRGLLQPRRARRDDGHDHHRRPLRAAALGAATSAARTRSRRRTRRFEGQPGLRQREHGEGQPAQPPCAAVPRSEHGLRRHEVPPRGATPSTSRSAGSRRGTGSTRRIRQCARHGRRRAALAQHQRSDPRHLQHVRVCREGRTRDCTIGANFSPIIHNVSTVRARNPDGSDDTIEHRQPRSRVARSSRRAAST